MTQNKKRLGLSISVALYEKLTTLAEHNGKTINSTCIDIFWDYFNQKQEANLPSPN